MMLNREVWTTIYSVNFTEGMPDSNPRDVILTSLKGAGPKRRNFAAHIL